MTHFDVDARVEIAAEIIEDLRAAATTALPYETGGLLIGWRDADRVVVRGWLQLGAASPGRNRFEIDAKKATSMLRRRLRRTTNSLEGYVGAWHTHPALLPPSRIDIETFSASAAATQAPLAFVVLATDGVASTAYIAWSGRRGDSVTVVAQEPIIIEGTRHE